MQRCPPLTTCILALTLGACLSHVHSGDAVPAGHHPPVILPMQPQEPTLAAPREGGIVLLHMYDGASFFRRLGALTGANKARYAERHGYEFVSRTPYAVRGIWKERTCGEQEEGTCWEEDKQFDIDHSRRATFGKLKFTIAACKRREGAWLLWSDADALIVNQTVPLEDLIDDGYDIMVSYDWLMLQAGVILFKCSPFTVDFLSRVYNDRTFDTARALDQSALQSYIDKMDDVERKEHVKTIPKHAFNVYLEEYRPGDFLVHMAGKLYEATEPGLWAIANQFDILSIVDDIEDISAFFNSRYFLNRFSGVCPVSASEKQSACRPGDERRLRLPESLGSMSSPNRYRHVGMRYYFLQDWKDKYDVPNWNVKRRTLPRRSSDEGGTKRYVNAFPVSDSSLSNGNVEPQPMTAPHMNLILDGAPRHVSQPKPVSSRPETPVHALSIGKAITTVFFFLMLALGFAAAYRQRRLHLSIKKQ